MLAAFGMPGHLELLIIGLVCLMMVGAPAVVVLIVLLAARSGRKPPPNDRHSDTPPS